MIMDEIEGLKAIYDEDIRITHGKSNCYVEFSLDKSNLLQFEITTQQQDELPKRKVKVVGTLSNARVLEEMLEELLESSANLFDAIQTARQWMEENGDNLDEVNVSVNTEDSQKPSVCKYFLENKCRFGEQCHFLHPGASIGNLGTSLVAERHDGYASLSVCENDGSSNHEEHHGSKFSNLNSDSVNRNAHRNNGRFEKKKAPMKTATDVIKRIMWDDALPAEDFVVGYIDRFIGIVEKAFNCFSWEDIASVDYSTLAIPKHRIQYFKYKDEIVWDKRTRLDKVFGSTGNDEKIGDIIENHQRKSSEDGSPSKKVKSDGDYDVEPEAEDLEDDDDDDEVDTRRKKWKDDDRPNFFFCFRITNNEIKEKINKVQTDIVSCEDILKEGCLKPDEFHVTLCMLRLNNDEEKAKAIKVMEIIQPTLVCMLPRSQRFLFEKIGNFRGRVLHVEVKQDPLLSKFVKTLMLNLKDAGIKTCGNQQPYRPHVTILKLSRPMCREMNTSLINPSLYWRYNNEHFGTQAINEIRLCSTSKQRDESGFYVELASRSNSLLCISEKIPSLVSLYVNELIKRSVLSEEEGDTLIEGLMSKDQDEFERVISDLESILEKQVKEIDNQRFVVIMRGLPGSGKSRMIKDSIEMRQARDEATTNKGIVVCGADEYFENSESGYRYVAGQLDLAHSYCREKFVSAIADNVYCIVIDNTNSQSWEYQIYTRIAKLCGYQVRCLEIACDDEGTLDSFVLRGQHNVSRQAVFRMWQRWETDDDAVVINPCFHGNQATYSLIGLSNKKPKEEPIIVHPKGILFSAVYLDPLSRAKLVSKFPPMHSKITASHMTLTYKPMKEEIPHIPVGKKLSLSVAGYVCNDVLQAVAVTEIDEKLCGTEVPHVTIANSKKAAPKHAKNALENVNSWNRPETEVILTGVVGVQVAISEKKSTTITDAKVFQEILCQIEQANLIEEHSVHNPQRSGSENHLRPEIYNGPENISSLFIFDFDGTLFHTPDPALGRKQYKDLTGERWPHKGWISRPESLQFPLRTYPGPSFVDFKEHLGRAGSLTVLLTARMQCTIDGVEEVLREYGIQPEKVFLKPHSENDDYKANRSPNFKADVIKQLLKTYPDVNHVKIWDDRQDNIDMFRRVKKNFTNVEFELFKVESMDSYKSDCKDISAIIDAFGFGKFEGFNATANEGIDFIINAWSTCLDVDPEIGQRLAMPFGSFPLQRVGDVDLCLLGPSRLSQDECILKLEAELSKRGIKHVHSATRIRCPRLKVRLHFMQAAPVDYDIVFATCLADLNSPEIDIATLYKHGSKKVKSALEGVLFLNQVRNCIDGKICMEDFGKLVDVIVMYLKTKHLKGNAFHCIRTFHIVRALAEMFAKLKPKFSYINDSFKNSLLFLSKRVVAYWKRICKDFVPDEMLSRTVQLFKDAVQTMNDSESLWEMFAFVKFPPENHTLVTLSVKSHVSELQWRASTLLEAKLGTCIRTLLSTGIEVVPGASDYGNVIQFAIPNNDWNIMMCKNTLKTLENETFFTENRDNLDFSINFK